VILNYAEAVDSLGNILGLQPQTGFMTITPAPVSGMGDEAKWDTRVRLYPNPASDRLIAEIDAPKSKSVVMHNSIGMQVYGPVEMPGKSLEIPTAHLVPGLYFITIETQEGPISRKIIIQR
jgi:hypothetical protein